MPDMKRVSEAIERAARENKERRAQVARFKRQLAATDRLLDLLERMNLAEIEHLGEYATRRISRTVQGLPPSLRPRVRPTTTVQCALDQVFEIQRTMFSERRSSRSRRGPPRVLAAAVL